ncbi:hypothetical protein RQP46_010440 [Phenoliferia psychrophenolica]
MAENVDRDLDLKLGLALDLRFKQREEEHAAVLAAQKEAHAAELVRMTEEATERAKVIAEGVFVDKCEELEARYEDMQSERQALGIQSVGPSPSGPPAATATPPTTDMLTRTKFREFKQELYKDHLPELRKSLRAEFKAEDVELRGECEDAIKRLEGAYKQIEANATADRLARERDSEAPSPRKRLREESVGTPGPSSGALDVLRVDVDNLKDLIGDLSSRIAVADRIAQLRSEIEEGHRGFVSQENLLDAVAAEVAGVMGEHNSVKQEDSEPANYTIDFARSRRPVS